MIIINVTEKQVVPNVNSAIRFPSLQFEIKTKELIPKEIPDDEIVKQLNISKNKEILNESEMAILDRIVQAMQNNVPLSKDEKSGLNSITYKLVGSKKRKVIKESIDISLKRRLTATSKNIIIDTVKNDNEVISDHNMLKTEHLKNTVKKIDGFINLQETKELIYAYFTSGSSDERSEIVSKLIEHAIKNPV